MGEPELRQEPLETVAGPTRERAPEDDFVLRGIFADDQDSCGAVKPAAMEDRPSFGSETLGGEDGGVWCVANQRPEELLAVTGVEWTGIEPPRASSALRRREPTERSSSDRRYSAEKRSGRQVG